MAVVATHADVRVEGVVTASSSGDRLAGAIVRLGERQTTTRSDGRFALAGIDDGEHCLEVSYLGFEDEVVNIEARG